MITDARAVRPGFIPRDLHHRDAQITHLSSVLTHGFFGETACVFGPSGAGKTTISKYVLSDLEREWLGMRWGYVNGMSDNSAAAALHRAVRELGLGADLRRRGEPTSVAVDRIRECDDHLAIVLDEVSVIDERALLALNDLPDISLVCITIDGDDWYESLSEQAESRMRSAETVRLEAYSQSELVDILESRVSHGLLADRVSGAALSRMAAIADGDARRAIALLRRAAQAVEQTDDEDELTIDTVERVVDDAETDIRERRIRSLGTHQRLLFSIIDERDGESVSSETLHTEYEKRAADPKARSTRRRYLKSLRRYNLIEASGNGRGRVYRPQS